MFAPASAAPETLPSHGFIDRAYYLARVGGPGGFLIVTGWHSLLDGGSAPVFVTVRAGEESATVACDIPRPDVAASDRRLSLNCGFEATIALDADLADDAPVLFEFEAAGRPCGRSTAPVMRPEREVDAVASTQSVLTRRKLQNLILNERERLSHAEITTALPVTGQIDPAFNCNLACPHCQSEMIRKDGFTMPLMKPAQLDDILGKYGDTLVRIWLSLWGEPLLNKALPEMIARCKQHDIWVLISSNMSVPLKEEQIEALVRSGLDSIILSVDGVTQATYEKYRINGELSLVLGNISRFVQMKKKLKSRTPNLYWRFLDFSWNHHEIEIARTLAHALEVDEFGVEPGVLTPDTKHPLMPRSASEVPRPPQPGLLREWQGLAATKKRQHREFGCDYLYSSMSVNANGTVHPCCYVVSPSHAVGDVHDSVDALRNGELLRGSRRLLADVAAGRTSSLEGLDPCVGCPVVADTGGHVVTQTSFWALYSFLMHGQSMGW